MSLKNLSVLIICISFLCNNVLLAQTDTLKVMTYNVLNYGNRCQGPNSKLHDYLKTIIEYTNPDILGLVKMEAIKINSSDNIGRSPVGFADSIITFALNKAYPDKYSYCTYTNVSGGKKMSVLFYNKNKLGFISTKTICTIVSDFNLYKLYYKDPNLNSTHDTTFLHIVLNHTKSGKVTSTRDSQDAAVVRALKSTFSHLPNLINMGDFNLDNSNEPGYNHLVSLADTSFILYDPPIYPEGKIHYPINWLQPASECFSYLTSFTRRSSSIPNNCGAGGGAMSWYDHIFLSSWIINNINYVSYIKGTYETVGNDGKRYGISINDSATRGKNKSVPNYVANALFQFSNKYPVSLKLLVSSNSSGKSVTDPELSIKSYFVK